LVHFTFFPIIYFIYVYSDLEPSNYENLPNRAILDDNPLVKFLRGLILVRIDHEPFNSTKGNRTEGERLAGFGQCTLINRI